MNVIQIRVRMAGHVLTISIVSLATVHQNSAVHDAI